MANVLVVTGSVRPTSAGKNVLPLVVQDLEAKGANVTVADVAELDLPFYNDPLPTSAPEFAPTDERVVAWTKLVAEADGVLLLTPEYNHTMTPVQLNAVDWIGKEWEDKPVALVGYGWRSGAGQAHATAREALAVNLKAKVGDDQTNLFFMKDLNPDGTPVDEAAVLQKIGASVDELLQATT
ncbi:MAG: NAD(P)H-dependent oxidoreductase [Candidatus Saccharimonas sp.]